MYWVNSVYRRVARRYYLFCFSLSFRSACSEREHDLVGKCLCGHASFPCTMKPEQHCGHGIYLPWCCHRLLWSPMQLHNGSDALIVYGHRTADCCVLIRTLTQHLPLPLPGSPFSPTTGATFAPAAPWTASPGESMSWSLVLVLFPCTCCSRAPHHPSFWKVLSCDGCMSCEKAVRRSSEIYLLASRLFEILGDGESC